VNVLLLLLVADVQGVVRDAHSLPLAGASISLSKEITTRADPEGRYRFASLPAGTYTLRAEMAGFAPAVIGPFSVADQDHKRVDVTLGATEFFDPPSFVIAGVTDTVNRGGHGSDAAIRSTEAVTRAAASLGREPDPSVSEESLGKDLQRDPQNATLHHSLAAVLEKHGDALGAAREYQRAAELSPSENNLFDWGTDLLTHRAPDQAVEVFTKGRRLFPASARMLLGLGSALYARGAYDQAAQRLFEATDLHPVDPEPYRFLGEIGNAEIIQTEGYSARMERFVRLHPERADARYFLAVALWTNRSTSDDGTRVIEMLEQALRLDPKLADAQVWLGIVYASRDDFSEAIASFRRAIELGTAHEEVHYRLAQAYQHTGESEEARKELEIYQRMRQTTAEDDERKRRQIQQFIFELRRP